VVKIRNGFVSNSSSSSFVVAFPEMPTSAEHVKKMMFGDDETFPNPYPISYSNRENEAEFPTMKIAETVYNDILEQKVNDKKNITEGFHGWLEGAPDIDYSYNKELTQEERNKEWDNYIKADNKFRKDTANTFIKERKDKFIYTFEYSDNDGDYFCTMEHGGIFDNIDHIRVSRH